jgi:hypothetical protein
LTFANRTTSDAHAGYGATAESDRQDTSRALRPTTGEQPKKSRHSKEERRFRFLRSRLR